MIEVASVVGLATVQDAGRAGHMHEGVPPGGAMVPEMLWRANAALGNAPGEAAIEVFGAITVVARERVVVASDDGRPGALEAGETCRLVGEKTSVRYLGVRGGIDVPRVLGGKGTLVVAGLGGHEGRPLRRGDVLRVGMAAEVDAGAIPALALETAVRVVLGPDIDRFEAGAIDTLLASTFTIDARSNRVGTRLVGPPLRGHHDPAALSAPMIRGAIQVPPSGELIVLGPDHPTTGGYPVIATVTREHLGSLAARPVGAAVRFLA
jgi:5-oxoprolinase (ATP-hydrolysing) subunit C